MSPFHQHLSDKAAQFLTKSFEDFNKAVHAELGDVPTAVLDVSLDESMEAFALEMVSKGIKLNGLLHAIAMDKTIRQKEVKPLLEVTKQEFADTMDISAFSLVRLTHFLMKHGVLADGASICSLSYIAAAKVTFHPYRNISIAKAALERITVELADELGRNHGMRVNAIRFSPYMGSKAGTATLRESDLQISEEVSPLGNALPQDLAREVVHLFRPGNRITGEIRHVDGGYNIMG